MVISNWSQFVLLLWKNWLLQKRRPIVTALQIIFPTLFAVVLLLLRMAVQANFVFEPTLRDSFDPLLPPFPPNLTLPQTVIDKTPGGGISNWVLAFAPNTSKAASRIAAGAAKSLNFTPFPVGTYVRLCCRVQSVRNELI